MIVSNNSELRHPLLDPALEHLQRLYDAERAGAIDPDARAWHDEVQHAFAVSSLAHALTPGFRQRLRRRMHEADRSVLPHFDNCSAAEIIQARRIAVEAITFAALHHGRSVELSEINNLADDCLDSEHAA